jgi:hypothetical protein
LIATVALLGSGCIKRVTVSEVLPVQEKVSVEELVSRINSYSEVNTFAAQGSVYVRNYFTGVGNKADEFPAANQLIRLQRPENIRMQVKAPVISSKVADMVSDGQQFRLAIYYPSSKRQFVFGSNLKEFDRMAADELKQTKDPQLAEAGGLINMRPQHITSAFLIKPTTDNSRTEVFREEVTQEETDAEAKKKNRRVIRTYYVLFVLERNDNSVLELRRKYWFDRTRPNTPLVRQQTFENGGGKVASDITYSDWFNVPDSKYTWPKKVIIDRRNDGYRIEIELEKDSVEINGELPPTTFKLENDENLKEKNLDAPRKPSATQNR